MPTKPIRTLSLWQPWASLMALGLKQLETRSWKTNYRGPIAIHAAKRSLTQDELSLCRRPAFLKALTDAYGRDWEHNMPFGAIVCVAELTDCTQTEWLKDSISADEKAAGNFGPYRFAWRLKNVRRLIPPVPAQGQQGFWAWYPPEGVLA